MSQVSETVVIIGGAIIGSFAAYFLRQEGFKGQIKIIEKDSTYQFSSTALSAASVRTQFGCPFNIGMSLFGVHVFKNVQQYFGDDADIGFDERGYLMLGSHDAAQSQRENAMMQREQGASIEILTPQDIRARYPWLNVDDIGIATYGSANEGWFDAWALLQLVRKQARKLGAEYINGEVTGIETSADAVVGVRLADGSRVACDWCVNAAGPAGGQVAGLAGVQIPVEPRKRTVFHFTSPVASEGFPMLFDNSGLWVRPEGDGFIAGIAPDEIDDAHPNDDFEPAHGLLEGKLWELLAHRIPAMEQLRLRRAWAGHYEMNLLDHNGIVGAHDTLKNFVLATGFSGHGVMHSPATGRGVAELITHGKFTSLDLSPLGFQRIRNNQPIVESVVY
ncbi:FAD-binding oxidoreductase [Pseudomonas sp. GD03842]|uniref:NAD(P)/FAD-dependent oxidoreductase n=1 Tax=unclassified Pseudomonas TaxID=196821 RepID=UPI000D37F70C|nr:MULTISPECIES: FAD-binding oxidoreductase [unclassified Pseudomonas]MDH0746929.1 FAD-binding oxidoreductase [Pseudomonas sp. GD03842]RAU43829.1 FAD-binding oxidoreductase [Pseudomonas sp. RIT 409]RAU56277.1 FAD-binding oxidoreductase [Pseudomonas sp. RIT 412]